MSLSRVHRSGLIALALALILATPACAAIENGDMLAPDGGGDDGTGNDDGTGGDDGSGDDDGTGDDDGDDGDDGDPPSVVAVSPEDGAIGVAADAQIVIAFSAAMDAGSVEAAWTSDDLPPVAFAWNAADTEVTITPEEPLALAEGSSPKSVVAREYSFVLTEGATDADGNHLAAPLEVAFTTQRRINASLARNSTLTRAVRSDGTVFSAALQMPVGDSDGDLQYKVFATFSLAGVPAGAVVEEAELSSVQGDVGGTPFASLGPILADQTAAAALGGKAFGAAAIRSLGVLSSSATEGPRTLDVTDAVRDDLRNRQSRGDRSQVRLGYATPTNGDGDADFVFYPTADLALVVTYLTD